MSTDKSDGNLALLSASLLVFSAVAAYYLVVHVPARERAAAAAVAAEIEQRQAENALRAIERTACVRAAEDAYRREWDRNCASELASAKRHLANCMAMGLDRPTCSLGTRVVSDTDCSLPLPVAEAINLRRERALAHCHSE